MSLNPTQQLIEAIGRANHILLTTRELPSEVKASPSLDGLGAGLGLAHFLERLGKQADIVVKGIKEASHLAFLPKLETVKPEIEALQKFIIKLDVAKTKINEISYDLKGDKLEIYVTPKQGLFKAEDIETHCDKFKYDAIIILDAPDLESLGEVFEKNTELFFNTPIINIDHSGENEHFGAINLVDLTASATCEVVYNHLENWDRKLIDEKTATYLLTGLIAKTQSFQKIKTPKTFQTAGRLVALGAEREKIMTFLFRNHTLETFRLWGVTLAHLKYDPTLKFAWSTLTLRDFLETGGEESELAGVVHELILNSKEAETVLLLYEKSEQRKICGLLFSTKIKELPLLNLPWETETKTTGFVRFCLIDKNLLEAEREIVEELKKKLYNITI